ncbi:MAG: hypothetical protein KKE02_07710 [Alphaproteobacteria bacterium]|nr:hypothetical protein [Alphaproteobacteria bacterium]MBU1512532.1 hypothetical protein [Alphaproteobacteria bacterium]MBU2092871.1 hypothetical protein [Alphaproteobacteria bacterium]MBU2150890.1 hypothetical protein [Alphaproteobacteria bacterium]MBU2307899.1 hypothetical protein [Alphaproteobacteria bacterium]
MRIALALIGFAVATAAHAAPMDEIAKLSWMAGSWIEDKVTSTTRETWLPPMGGAMAGAGQTNAPGRKPRIEHMKITVEPAGVTYTAIVPGQPPTPFVLLPGPQGQAVFENKDHDYPQRVIYRRCGEQLCAGIEGVRRGEPASESWIYRRLP